MYLIAFPTSFLSYLHVQMNMAFPEFESTMPTSLCPAWTSLGAFMCPRKHDWSKPGSGSDTCLLRALLRVALPQSQLKKRTKSRKVTRKINSSL